MERFFCTNEFPRSALFTNIESNGLISGGLVEQRTHNSVCPFAPF